MEILGGIIEGVMTALSVVVAFFMGKRQMYVDVVTKKRMESVNERRDTLKELYLYTNPEYVNRVDNSDEYIKTLLKTQSALEYKLMDQLHPEGEIIEALEEMVKKLIDMVETGYNKGDRSWFIKHKEYDSFVEKRKECLGTLKIYNFASWKFVQTQSKGKQADSITAFNKSYQETLTELEIEKERDDTFWERMKKLI